MELGIYKREGEHRIFMDKVGFIGCGNMGSVLCSAAVKAIGKENVFAADLSQSKAAATGAVLSSAEEIAKTCGFVVLGVKPQVLDNAIDEIAPIISGRADRPVIISMAAGVPKEHILAKLNCEVIRIMPNTPCNVGMGMILYCTSDGITENDESAFLKMFEHCGRIDRLDEKYFDSASAISGCGPAFVYMFAEAMADGGVYCGLPRDKAIEYAAQTILGSAEMILKSGKHPGKLKDEVTSPGGTTIAGVLALENGGFRSSVMNSIIEAKNRTIK